MRADNNFGIEALLFTTPETLGRMVQEKVCVIVLEYHTSSEGVHSSASSLEGANATPGISGSSKRFSQSLIVPLNDLTRPLTYRAPDSYQSGEFSHHNWTIKQKL